jgi:hypothetical protein
MTRLTGGDYIPGKKEEIEKNFRGMRLPAAALRLFECGTFDGHSI